MLENGLFADHQDVFVPNRSYMTQLLCVIEDWTKSLDNGNSIDTIFLDFQKAFDSVPHESLMCKLSSIVHGVMPELSKLLTAVPWSYMV